MKAPHSLIVGGTRGIGRELADHLLRSGHEVSVIARQPPKRKLARAHYWTVDICDEMKLTVTLRQIVEKAGKINHLIFFQRFRGHEDAWHGEIETSLTATKRIVEALHNKFAAGNKAIIVVSSVNAGLIGGNLPLSYHVAKAALRQMVRYWAVGLGPLGIRVNSVSPGTVLKEESKAFFVDNKKLSSLYRRITPLRRFGHAREVAQVIGCLCSEQTSFVTGQDIVVDGGVSLQWQESLARELLNIPAPPSNQQKRQKARVKS